MTNEEAKAEFFRLMERYCQLGNLLPSEDDLRDDRAKLHEGKVILAEMDKTKKAMDAILSRANGRTN